MLRRPLVWAGTFAVLIATQACEHVLTPSFRYASVEVVVTLPEGQGVSGVPLVLYNGTRHLGYAKTDSFGVSRFDLVPEGDIGVSAVPIRYFYATQHPDGYYRTFSVAEGDTIQVEFQYEDARGSIAVRVLDRDSIPQPGSVVELYTSRGTQERTALNESGSVLFSELIPADYGVRVLGSGACPLLPEGFVYRDGLLVGLRQDLEIQIVLPACSG